MAISRDAVIWGYRFFLGRDPESEAIIQDKLSIPTNLDLARELAKSNEFRTSGRYDKLFGNSPAKKQPSAAAAPVSSAPVEAVATGMRTMPISELPEECFRGRGRDICGTITFPASEEEKLRGVAIYFHGSKDPAKLDGVELYLESIPQMYLALSHSGQRVRVGKECTGRWVFHMWGVSTVTVGDRVTSNGTECFVNPGGSLIVGEDCMFANAFVHVGDNHAIIDAESGKALNYSDAPRIEFKKHVWVASRVTVMSDSTIGAGCVLGAASVVKGDFPAQTVVAGVPAKVVRDGVTWTRSVDGIEAQDVIDFLKS